MSQGPNFQRVGSISNAHVGADFEAVVCDYWRGEGVTLSADHQLMIGQPNRVKKARRFDLGSSHPPIIVECKSHKWTSTGNMPSAKMTVWNESMYYFSLAPRSYRKLFCVLNDRRSNKLETLAEYYVRVYNHLIPEDVEVWEFDLSLGAALKLV